MNPFQSDNNGNDDYVRDDESSSLNLKDPEPDDKISESSEGSRRKIRPAAKNELEDNDKMVPITFNEGECEINIRNNPFDIISRFRLAELWIKKHIKLDEAERMIHSIQVSQPKYRPADLEMLLGDRCVCPLLKLYKEGIAHYNKASELNPFSVEAMVQQGITFEKMGEIADAVRAFKKALRRDPTHFLST